MCSGTYEVGGIDIQAFWSVLISDGLLLVCEKDGLRFNLKLVSKPFHD